MSWTACGVLGCTFGDLGWFEGWLWGPCGSMLVSRTEEKGDFAKSYVILQEKRRFLVVLEPQWLRDSYVRAFGEPQWPRDNRFRGPGSAMHPLSSLFRAPVTPRQPFSRPSGFQDTVFEAQWLRGHRFRGPVAPKGEARSQLPGLRIMRIYV